MHNRRRAIGPQASQFHAIKDTRLSSRPGSTGEIAVEFSDYSEFDNFVGFAGYFYIAGYGKTINESQVDHRGLPAAELRHQANLRTTSFTSHRSQSRPERQAAGTVEDAEEMALVVNRATRWIGLIMMTTLLAGSVAAEDLPLPDPDGLELP